MATLKLRIGASVDSSVASSFLSVEKMGQRTGNAIRKNMGDATRAVAHAASAAAGPYRQTGLAATEAGKRAKDAGAAMVGSAKQTIADFKALREVLQKMPADFKTLDREAQRALKNIQRQNARDALGLTKPAGGAGGGGGRGRHSRFWSAFGGNLMIQKPHMDTLSVDRVLGGIGHYGMGALGFARHAAMGVAHAAGIETDFSRLAEKNVDEEKVAQQIVNSGYIPGSTGAAGILRNKGDILAQARATAASTGTERGTILEGLQSFTGLTGDLKLGLDLMDKLARLSRATGSNFVEMSEASAEVSNHLGDIPDKAGVTESIMRAVAGQGKLGAVEIRDMATQMAKIAATANRFKGGAAANIATLGVFAQESKLEGGSANATQAGTAVARFASALATPATIGHWLEHKIDPYTDKSHSILQDPISLVKMALTASSKGNKNGLATAPILKQLFGSEMGYRAVAGWQAVYNRAGGGQAGLAAVDAEFQRLSSAMLTNEEVDRAFAASMQTAEAKSKQFNEALAGTVEQLEGALLPAVMELAPLFLQMAGWMADLAKRAADWFTEGKVTRDAAQGATVSGDNAIANIEAWEDANLADNAESPGMTEAEARKAAEKPIGIFDAEIAKSQAQLDPLAKKVREEGKQFSTLPVSEWGEAEWSYARSGGTAGEGAAMQFKADYDARNRLQATLDHLKEEKSALINTLTSGRAVVRVVQDLPPAASNKGALPAKAPVPGAHP